MKPNITAVCAKLENMHEDILEIKTTVNQQNGRVRKLEQFKSWALGGLSILSLLLALGMIKLFT